jgi:hypothetical protein
MKFFAKECSMRKRNALLTSAILAVTGLGLADPMIGLTRAADPADQPAGIPRTGDASRANADATSGDRHQAMQVKGVQDLFAQATDAAVMKGGLSQLDNLFVDSSGANASTINKNNGARDDQPARADRDATNRSGAASDPRPGTPSGQRAATIERPSPTGTGQPAGADTARNNNDATKNEALDNTVDQFNQAWKAKYGKDPRIADGQVVYSDITANDIVMGGQAQPASGVERGSGNDGATAQPGKSGVQGVNGDTSVRDGANASKDAAGRPITPDNTRNTDAAAGNTNININEETKVNVPAVGDAKAVKLHLLRTGPGTYRFASRGPIDQQRLASALQKHLQEVLDAKAQWPADANQGERLVSQHVLMAIAEVSHRDRDAQPAGAHLPGDPAPAKGAATDVDQPNGNGTGVGNAPGTNGSAPK